MSSVHVGRLRKLGSDVLGGWQQQQQQADELGMRSEGRQVKSEVFFLNPLLSGLPMEGAIHICGGFSHFKSPEIKICHSCFQQFFFLEIPDPAFLTTKIETYMSYPPYPWGLSYRGLLPWSTV